MSTSHPVRSVPAPPTARLWRTAGWLTVAYVVLLFAGSAFQTQTQLGDSAAAWRSGLVESSLTRNFAGGYVEYLASLLFLLASLLFARLLRGRTETTGWLGSCIAAAAVADLAVTVSTGFAAGAAALYDGHHGAALATATTVGDIRNFGFLLSGGLVALFAAGVGAAGRLTRTLPRSLTWTGFAVAALILLGIPADRTGAMVAGTMLSYVWLLALGIVSLRRAGRVADTERAEAVTGRPVGADA
jgi:hypothetical protein